MITNVQFQEIVTEEELLRVLKLCHRILGDQPQELYGVDAWRKRLADGLQPLLYAEAGGQVVSAVLGRAESAESLVIGFVACDEAWRMQGITRELMGRFEKRAREMGFKAITLASKADAFYEKCGYHVIFQTHGQNVYQKLL